MSEYIKWVEVGTSPVEAMKNKIPGGSERGSTTFISRSPHNSSVYPGNYIEGVGRHPKSAFFAYRGGTEWKQHYFDIATGDEREFKWVAQSGPFNKFNILANGGIPVDGGFEPINGEYDLEPLYVARAPVPVGKDINIVCGWVSEGAVAVISYDNEVHDRNEYEVLVYIGPSLSAPEPFPLNLPNYIARLLVSEYIKWVDYEKHSAKPVESMITCGIKGVSTEYIARILPSYSHSVYPGYYESRQNLGHLNTQIEHEREIPDKFQIAIGDERNFKWVPQTGRFNRSSILQSGCIPVEIGHILRSATVHMTFSARARLAHENKFTDFAYGWVEEHERADESVWLDRNGKMVEVTEYEVLALCITTPPTFPQLPSSMPWLPSPLLEPPPASPQPELSPASPELPPPSPDLPPSVPEPPPTLPELSPSLPEFPPTLPEPPSPLPELRPPFPELPPPFPELPPTLPELPPALPQLPSSYPDLLPLLPELPSFPKSPFDSHKH